MAPVLKPGVARQIYEETMLKALNDFSPGSLTVKPPHLYLFDQETNTQVIEDLQDAVTVLSFFTSPTANTVLTRPVASSIGHELGSWLRQFHDWAASPAQSALWNVIGHNEPMRGLKRRITYDSFLEVLENFPWALDGDKETLERVREMGAEEFAKQATDERDIKGFGIVHGDFWMGK